ncbi:glycosyltransferase [Methanoculleus chikugoensis]|uniref:Glycosyl transferase n=1 Tax=Methanoculleus chikugoensis TaxID=118126 RepID=A0ABM7H751_9EURY|nr:glycosyltransferase [Methanoculleus chikugoensis]BBL68636.1 glycosyl transferase [Methanoculleus chikugoensis]
MTETELAPITLFVYNRPLHTRQTVEALQKNELASESEIFIYSDAPKTERAVEDVARVREYIKTIDGFKKVTIIERSENWGLADSIIDGVTKIVNDYGRVIVLEDDLVTSPYFLRFMNEGLEFYHCNPEIMSISGYTLPPVCMSFPENFPDDIYLNYRNSSWGWATWADRWNLVDWEIKDYRQFINDSERQKQFNRGGDDLTNMLKLQMEGKINSWAIRFSYAHFKHRMYSICPRYSYVNNIGLDGTGTHCDKTRIFENDLSRAKRTCTFIKDIQLNKDVMLEFWRFHRKKSLIVRGINKVSRDLFNRNVIR